MSAPDRIDRYEIQGIIGHGSMGVVYRARDPIIGRQVALKTVSIPLHASTETDTEPAARFAREARTAGFLSHPNIVTVYDAGSLSDPGSSYIAMELVEGRSLRQVVPSGESMPLASLLDVAMQVARALDYAHENGVVHRDVKPANILIRDDGLVKLADFGVARMESSDLTRTGESVGSPSYIAPEMLKDGGGDARADLFSLGVVFYEMLTGKKPFRADSLATLYNTILNEDHITPSSHDPAIPAEWDSVIEHLLTKDPENRYQKASQLIDDLRAIERGMPLKFARYFPDSTIRILPFEDADEPDQRLDVMAGQMAIRGRWVPGRLHMAAFTGAAFLVAVIGVTAVLNSSPRTVKEPAEVPAAAVEPPIIEGIPDEPQAPALLVIPRVVLTVRLDHNLRQGHLDISMDGEPFLSDPFASAEKRRLRIRDRVERLIDVPQGAHVFRVTITDHKGRSWVGVTTRDLGPGENVMAIELKGIMKKRLRVEWDPLTD